MADTTAPVFLARQPIYDGKQQVFGYELLYRRGEDATFAGDLTVADSARSLANALIEIGLNELVGRSKAFINVSEEMIVAKAVEAFPHKRVVVEVLEHVPPTPDVIAELRRLKHLGYTIALDDFLWNDLTEPMLPFADIIKVDIADVGFDALPELCQRLKQFPAVRLAERVETHEEQRECAKLGFELFQGYYMAKPQLVRGRGIRTNHLALVRLISRMNAPDLTLDELERLVASDVQLNVKLLKFIKSAYFGLPTKVDSIRQALMFVGVSTLAAVATLLMMSQFANKPQELVFTAMVRAKMAERLGSHLGHKDVDRHFTVGMLSVLDALMDLPMAELLKDLPLTEEVEAALTCDGVDSDLAHVLRIVRAYERGSFESVSHDRMPLDVASSAYRFALGWASQTQSALAA